MGDSIDSKPLFKNTQFLYNHLEEMTQIYLPQPALSHPLRYTRYDSPHCRSQGLQLHTCICATLWLIPSWKKAPVELTNIKCPESLFLLRWLGKGATQFHQQASHPLHLLIITNVNNNIYIKSSQGLLQEWKRNLLLGLRGEASPKV